METLNAMNRSEKVSVRKSVTKIKQKKKKKGQSEANSAFAESSSNSK